MDLYLNRIIDVCALFHSQLSVGIQVIVLVLLILIGSIDVVNKLEGMTMLCLWILGSTRIGFSQCRVIVSLVFDDYSCY